MNRNLISEIELGACKGLNTLIWHELGVNKLNSIHSNIFIGLSNLQTLGLASNILRTLEPNVFQKLPKLRLLSLSYNQLFKIRKDMWGGISSLKVLHLRSNKISTLPSGVFGNLPYLEELDLEFNQLKTLNQDIFTTRDGGHTSGSVLQISNNPVHCDQNLCCLRQEDWIKIKSSSTFCTNYPGQEWKNVNLNCDENAYNSVYKKSVWF